jgi:hypothetical protein
MLRAEQCVPVLTRLCTWWCHPLGTNTISPASCITSSGGVVGWSLGCRWASSIMEEVTSYGRLPWQSRRASSCPGGKNNHFFLPQMLTDQLKERKMSAWKGDL